MGKIEHFFLGKRDLQKENHWEELDIETFKITKPTVLCFGGNSSLKPNDANYMCKVAQSLVGIREPRTEHEFATTKDVDFIGIAYGDSETIGFGKRQRIDDIGSLTEEEISELANQIFAPFYFDQQMKIRSKDEICKNFSLITFFSHCHGAKEILFLLRKVYHNMVSVGINQETANDAINHLYSVSYAPMVTVPCPGLQVISEKDMTNPGAPAYSPITHDFIDKIDNQHTSPKGGTIAFKENEQTISLVASSLTQEEQCDEHPINYIQRDLKWNLIEKQPTYGNEVSIAMGVALSYSIANSIQNHQSNQLIEPLNTDQILSEIQSIIGQTINDNFNQAIEEIRER